MSKVQEVHKNFQGLKYAYSTCLKFLLERRSYSHIYCRVKSTPVRKTEIYADTVIVEGKN